MKVTITTDREPTTAELDAITAVANILINEGMEVDVVGHRPGDRK